MRSVFLGHDLNDKTPVEIPKSAFSTHFHLIGGTGKGKTTAIHTMLHPLLRDPRDRRCAIVFDRLGNLTDELLLWMASPDYCTDYVRDRLVYIQPSREDVVLGFNPLLHETQAHGYYKVERATEIILRAWESVNIEAMPRLARWTFNSFWAVAQLGLTIADCAHLLIPGSKYHRSLLRALPDGLRAEWSDILKSGSGAEATRILDSSRNRLKPYFESDILRRMFGATHNQLDIEQFMREGKIVLIDLSPRNRLSGQLANTIGALILNEIIATARNLGRFVRYPTYLFLDEFQNFVGPDIDQALPEVRQLGLNFVLSHQSFAQLQRGDYDLTNMIFQAQSRMIFGVQGEDADILAHELASISYDPKKIKEEILSRRQRIKGHRLETLSSWSDSESAAENWNKTYGQQWKHQESVVKPPEAIAPTRGTGSGHGQNENRGEGGSTSSTRSRGGHETLVPEHEDFIEVASRTFFSFDEQKVDWAQQIRKLLRGETLLRLVDQGTLRHVRVKRSAPGVLKYDIERIHRYFPDALKRAEDLIEANFASDIFTSAAVIDRQMEKRMDSVLRMLPNPDSVDDDGGDSYFA